MKRPCISIGDVGRHIQRPLEDEQTAIERARNWSECGIIRPIKEKQVGTGRHRAYSDETLRYAAIVDALCSAHIPAITAHEILKSEDLSKRVLKIKLAQNVTVNVDLARIK